PVPGSPAGSALFARGGGLSSPTGLAFGPDGNLYVASTGTSEVLRYNGMTGEFQDVFITRGSGGLFAPRHLAFAPVPQPGALALRIVGAVSLSGAIGARRLLAAARNETAS